MQRVLIIGSTGSGKTTLARRLADTLQAPWLELDSLFHGPQPVREWPQFRGAVQQFVKQHPRWVIDGNYKATRKLLMQQADTVIWLDMPVTTRALGLLRRTLDRLWRGKPLLNGNPKRREDLHSLDPKRSPIVRSVSTKKQKKDRKTLQKAVKATKRPKRTELRFRSREDLNRWLRELAVVGGQPGVGTRGAAEISSSATPC